MKNPKNLLIFAILGGVVGLGLGFILGRMSAPKQIEISLPASLTETQAGLVSSRNA